MDDSALRAWMSQVPMPTVEGEAFVEPPPLDRARVAIVTTAGLMRRGESAWTHEESGFRVFDADERDVFVGHVSQNFDRSGVSADLNVVYPIDRLRELEAAGTIGSVAPRHFSFMGATYDIAGIQVRTGPAAAQLLLEDEVDVVLLTPV